METPAGKQKYDGLRRFLADHTYIFEKFPLNSDNHFLFLYNQISIAIHDMHHYNVFWRPSS